MSLKSTASVPRVGGWLMNINVLQIISSVLKSEYKISLLTSHLNQDSLGKCFLQFVVAVDTETTLVLFISSQLSNRSSHRTCSYPQLVQTADLIVMVTVCSVWMTSQSVVPHYSMIKLTVQSAKCHFWLLMVPLCHIAVTGGQVTPWTQT